MYKITKMARNKTIDNFFDIIDSDIKAYLLGFFIADGCISKDTKTPKRKAVRFSVNLSEKDSYITKLFKDNICPDNNLISSYYTKGAVNRQPTIAIKWSSKYMNEILKNKYNITERKTYDLDFIFPFEEIDKIYINSFIRGFFDGDGHISHTLKNQFTLGLYGTSYKFLEQIGNIISDKFKIKSIIDSSKKANVVLYCLRFNSNYKRKDFIKSLYDWLYTDEKYFLERKKLKFESYLNTVLTKENNIL